VFGLSTLFYALDYVDGGAYEDGGIGFSLGYRPVPQFEIEAAYGRYTDSLLEGSRERLNRPFQLTGQLHPFPNALLSPFLVGGYAWNDIVLNDTYLVDGDESVAVQDSVLEGLVLGAGMTLNVHQNVALELDGRLFQYNNIEYWQPAGDTATLVSMGVVLSF
jgi:opacity protein-like surface antigen